MITDDQIIDHLDTVVAGLNLLNSVVGEKAGHTAETVVKIATGLIGALRAKTAGRHVDADALIADMRRAVHDRDEKTLDALNDKFDGHT